jgi:hypothetical protein
MTFVTETRYRNVPIVLGVIERDEIVFRAAIERKIPIVMLLSGNDHQQT